MSAEEEEDPFALFGGDDDGDDAASSSGNGSALRPKENGLLSFHPGTEESLLIYVAQSLSKVPSPPPPDVDLCSLVLSSVDSYCHSRHWMMHIGDEKASILSKALSSFASSFESDPNVPPRPFAVLEVGTYCGYSALVMSRALQVVLSASASSSSSSSELHFSPPPFDYRIVTLEADVRNASVARRLIALAGPPHSSRISVLPVSSVSDGVLQILSVGDSSKLPQLYDALFLDHYKCSYYPDVKLLASRQACMLSDRALVVADNVVFGQCDDYLRFVRSGGIEEGYEGAGLFTRTELVQCDVEYSGPEKDELGEDNVKDGVEISHWKKNEEV